MNTYIVTYQDMVEHLLDMFNESRTGRPLRTARRACRDALRELHMSHRWIYYNANHLFSTSASYSTGTIEYDHTGGTYERLITLTGGTFPSYAGQGKIIIDSTHYPVDLYVDSTNITLRSDINPGSDLAAGTSYTLYRESYPLPVNCGDFGTLIDLTNDKPIAIINSDQQIARKAFRSDTPDTPWFATIRNDEEYLNSNSIVFVPPPSSAIKYQMTYQRSPRMLKTELHNTGTVSAGSGSTSVSVATGAFTTDHIGCVIRFGTSADAPTSVFGGLDDTDNPFVDQAVIVSVSSDGTGCVIDNAVSKAYTDVKYTVSDPLDIEVNVVLTAYQRMAESIYSVYSKRDSKERRDREQLAQIALLQAKERDTRTTYADVEVAYDPFNNVTITDED